MSNKSKLLIGILLFLLLVGGSLFSFRGRISNYFVDKAYQNIAEQKLQLAKRYLNMAKVFNQNSARYHFWTGYIAWLEKNNDEAIHHYSAALDFGFIPRERVLLDRASIYHEQKKYDKALVDYEELSKIKPNDPLINYRIAAVYAETGKTREAISILKNVLEVSDTAVEKVDVYDYLGRAYYLIGSYKESAEAYRKSFELISNQPLIVTVRYARALKNSGDIQGALSEIDKVLKTNPDYKPALCALSGIYIKTGEYDKSIDATQKALKDGKVEANNISCLYHSASAYYSKGDDKSAKSNLEKLLDNFQKLSLIGPDYEGLKTSAEDLLAKIK